MDSSMCLSVNFVNKQNVRSLGNIFSRGVLVNPLFEENLAKEASTGLLTLIAEVRINLKSKSKGDFKEYFEAADRNSHYLQPVNKQMVFENSWRALTDIVPKELFGDNNLNVKIFKGLVELTVFSMKNQHVVVEKIVDKWHFSSLVWNSQGDIAKQILYHLVVWIIKYILSPIISLNFYVTTCKIDGDENKLHYFWKNQWQSFYDKTISEMIFIKIIKKHETYSLGKKIKNKHSMSERLKLKSFKKDIPKLHLILKINNNYRPIVQYKTNSQSPTEKYKIKERLNFLKNLIGKLHKKIETLYSEVIEKWLNLKKPKLYFVKTDLSNAFGAVNKEKLLKIVAQKYAFTQKDEKNLYLKKKYAQQYKDLLSELHKPLLVRTGSTVYEWKEGLVQGYKYSPALSELYYQHMDELYFSEHFKHSKAKIRLFTRVVDDYLYITDSIEDAQSFLTAVNNYRNVNHGKTEVNFPYPGIKFSEEITFLGNSYNTKNMEVGRANNAFVGQMCYKIAFTGAVTNLNNFIENRISQSGIPISSHIFNFWHNPEKLIWQHIFTTYCLSANKFCTSLAILCEEKDMTNYLALYKKKVVVKLSNSIVETLLKNKPPDFQFVFCANHLRHLSWKALYLCAKGTPKCSELIPKINDELSKTNCLFGKWREHASSINTNGEIIEMANKQVCRRLDLRILVREFDKLPKGFECYNHRRIMKETK